MQTAQEGSRDARVERKVPFNKKELAGLLGLERGYLAHRNVHAPPEDTLEDIPRIPCRSLPLALFSYYVKTDALRGLLYKPVLFEAFHLGRRHRPALDGSQASRSEPEVI